MITTDTQTETAEFTVRRGSYNLATYRTDEDYDLYAISTMAARRLECAAIAGAAVWPENNMEREISEMAIGQTLHIFAANVSVERTA